MKKILLMLLILPFLFQACTKEDPIPESDQEEVFGLKLTFTEVKGEAHDDHYHYTDIENPAVETIDFTGTNLIPPVGAHLHLEVGKSYRFEVKMKDAHGRETQQSFVDRDTIHYAFILGAPTGSLHVQYSDLKTDKTKVKVGVTGYFTILAESSTFEMNYIMRHLNAGVKAGINPKTDWSNKDYRKFTGANDVDIKFGMHFVKDEDHTGH